MSHVIERLSDEETGCRALSAAQETYNALASRWGGQLERQLQIA
jgi:hypothetical protein